MKNDCRVLTVKSSENDDVKGDPKQHAGEEMSWARQQKVNVLERIFRKKKSEIKLTKSLRGSTTSATATSSAGFDSSMHSCHSTNSWQSQQSVGLRSTKSNRSNRSSRSGRSNRSCTSKRSSISTSSKQSAKSWKSFLSTGSKIYSSSRFSFKAPFFGVFTSSSPSLPSSKQRSQQNMHLQPQQPTRSKQARSLLAESTQQPMLGIGRSATNGTTTADLSIASVNEDSSVDLSRSKNKTDVAISSETSTQHTLSRSCSYGSNTTPASAAAAALFQQQCHIRQDADGCQYDTTKSFDDLSHCDSSISLDSWCSASTWDMEDGDGHTNEYGDHSDDSDSSSIQIKVATVAQVVKYLNKQRQGAKTSNVGNTLRLKISSKLP